MWVFCPLCWMRPAERVGGKDTVRPDCTPHHPTPATGRCLPRPSSPAKCDGPSTNGSACHCRRRWARRSRMTTARQSSRRNDSRTMVRTDQFVFVVARWKPFARLCAGLGRQHFRHLSNLRFCQLKQQIMDDSRSVLVEMTLTKETVIY